jgi:hypothetical protein
MSTKEPFLLDNIHNYFQVKKDVNKIGTSADVQNARISLLEKNVVARIFGKFRTRDCPPRRSRTFFAQSFGKYNIFWALIKVVFSTTK